MRKIIDQLADLTTDRQDLRLPRGGQIDRLSPISFQFNGITLQGYRGDSLASALLANGVRLVGRSFKYHRPRGILTAGSEEPNALVELRSGPRREPNTRATVVELFPGLEARSQNSWPHVAFDAMAVNQFAGPLFAAGFYYKTFMGSGLKTWMFFERIIRRAAGLGRAAESADPDIYDRMHQHCDVLVIGGGAAGLMAAKAAAGDGLRVVIVDEQNSLGGRLLSERETVAGQAGANWASEMAAALAEMPGVSVLTRTTAFGIYDDQWVGAVERVADHLPTPEPHQVRQRYWKIQARKIILASGAIERPLVFPGNDRPGVMMASAVRSYVNRYAVAPGKRAVIFTNNDDGYQTALDLLAAGLEVNAVVDPRTDGGGELAAAVADAGVTVMNGHVVTGTQGGRSIVGAEVMAVDRRTGLPIGDPMAITCDHIAISGGWDPALHLLSHAGAKAEWDPALNAFRPGPGSRADCVAIGAAKGDFELADCLAGGAAAGAAARQQLGYENLATDVPAARQYDSNPLQPLWNVPKGPNGGKSFIDFQHDVTVEDIAIATRESYISVEHLKRYTTLGMATDQGKLSNVNGLALLAAETGNGIPETGTTRFRPPYTPVALGAFVGRDVGDHESPIRRSAMHDWHLQNGAVMGPAGAWVRPQYYLRGDEVEGRLSMDQAITREVTGVRQGVGLVDVSTLGKIDLQGADSAEFLNRLYTSGWKTLPVGKARYGLMLREDGLAYDDGTTSRLAENHYMMTTTTGNAGVVMSTMEWYLQVVWPELDVRISSVTEQWAAMALAGPRARAALQAAVPELDVSEDGLPFMGVVTATIGGAPVRIFRISFSGELSYEINTPADYGSHVWESLMIAGQPLGIIPYGLEAMGIMRIEKGHPVAAELNGQTTADDLGLGRMMSSKKDFIGRILSGREGLSHPDRPQLVGLVPVDGKTRIQTGAHLVASAAASLPNPSLGWVSSSAYLSPTLGHPIALGFLAGGRGRIGETVWGVSPLHNQKIALQVVNPVFLDPEGERLRLSDDSQRGQSIDTTAILTRRSGFAAVLQAGAFGASGPGRPMVRFSIRADMAQLQIDLDSNDAASVAAVEAALNVSLPSAGRANGGGRQVRVIWAGPDRWLVVLPADDERALSLPQALQAAGATVVDQSHARSVIRMRGDMARKVLSKGTTIDLDPCAFGGDDVRLTAAFHAAVIFDARDDGAAIDVFVARGFAEGFWGSLTDAAAEFGYQVG